MRVDDDRAFAFLASLQDQLDLYKKIRELSRGQEKLIADRKEEELMRVMVRKQEIIEQIEKRTGEFQRERETLDSCEKGEFSSIDEELDKVLAAIETVLRDIIEIESNDMERLNSLRQDHTDKMELIGKGKNLAKAYQPHSNLQKGKMDTQG